jgi:hypothetical protein
VHEEVVEPLVVGERRRGDGVAALPAADQVQKAVDPAEALDDSGCPLPRGVLGEEVDDTAVEAILRQPQVRAELVKPVPVHVGGGDRRAVIGQAAGDRGSEAAGGAGDGDHASVELGHRGGA